MTSPNVPETARRYPEAYEWNAKREQQGRRRIKSAVRIALAVGAVCGLLAFGAITSAMNDPRAAVVGLFFGVLVGFVLGAIFYEWWYNSGLKMVLTAQQILVAIDTEHNTREIAEALRRSQTVKS